MAAHNFLTTEDRGRKAAELMTWASSNGCTHELSLHWTRAKGLQGSARAAIAPGAVLARCPLSLVLHHRAALADEAFGTTLGVLRRSLGRKRCPNRALVCLYLLFQRSLGRHSRWHAYIQSLPESTAAIDSALTWTAAEVGYLLQGTPLRRQVEQNQSALFAEHSLLVSGVLASSDPSTFGDPNGTYGVEAYLWANAVFYSRAIKLNVRGETLECLLPVVDALNHTPASCAALETTGSDYVLRAGRGLAKGEAVEISYGARGNGDLLHHFGFTIADNPADVCAVDVVEDLAAPPNEATKEAIRRTLAEESLPSSFFLFRRMDDGEAASAQYLPHGFLDAAKIAMECVHGRKRARSRPEEPAETRWACTQLQRVRASMRGVHGPKPPSVTCHREANANTYRMGLFQVLDDAISGLSGSDLVRKS